MWKKERERKKKRKQSGVTAMQKNFKMKEGGNKRVEGEGRKKILEEHQSRGEVQRSWHTYDSLFHSLRPSPPLNIFSFRSFFPPLPPFSLSSLPPFLFYYLWSGLHGPLRVPALPHHHHHQLALRPTLSQFHSPLFTNSSSQSQLHFSLPPPSLLTVWNGHD